MKILKILIILILGCLVVGTPGIYMAHFLGRQFKFQVQFFDIGQGDATLIRFENGQKMLVDCGPDKKILNKLGRAMSFFDTTIDYLVVTHFDLDHYGGCIDVVKRYQIKTIFTNGYHKPHDLYWNSWKELTDKEVGAVKVIGEYKQLQVANSMVEFMSPFVSLKFSSSTDKSNNHSIVFRLVSSSTHKTFLFTGDIEEAAEGELLKKYCADISSKENCPNMQATILKVPHHGSDTSSSKEFLTAVDPQEVIISVGAGNRFGHPSARVINRLERLGVEILRTDKKGDILISS